MNKNLLKISLCVLSLCFLISCSTKKESSKIFRYNETQGIENIDPVAASNYPTVWPLNQCLEGLLEYNNEMKLQPLLASAYKISEDALAYTFYIRKGVRFHDDECFPDKKGREIISRDFKYCFERLCDSRTKTRGAWLFRDRIAGAKEFINSIKDNTNKVTEITGIKCPDDTTLVITLTRPFAPFLSILTMTYASVYPKEAVEHYKDNFAYHPVGTGPFKFVKWDFDREMVFEINPAYWNSTLGVGGKLDGFKITFTKSSETAFLDFKDGKLDYYEPSPEVLSQVTDENGKLLPEYSSPSGVGGFELVRKPWLNTVYLAIQLDTQMPGGKNNLLSNNKKLRQAISYAIDREKIIKYVLKFRGHSGDYGPVSIGMPGFDSTVKGYKFDLQKSKQLLDEAGYPEGKGLSLKLTVSNAETSKQIGETVQGQLKDAGINVELDFIQASTLRSSQVGGELAFWRADWGADYFDPENFMALLYSKNKTPDGPNYTHYSNTSADSLYELALKETDFNIRAKLYNQMQNLVMEDAPWIVLYYNELLYFKRKNIKGMYVDGLNTLVLKYAEME